MKHTFEIRDTFYLDGEPFRIISGSIHYFRTVPEYWRDRLEKLKAMGANTVETYIPWNMHEKKKGEFDFSGMLDVERFIRTAQELGLWVIIRPSPYICAEWEMGGLPGWLLKTPDIRLRSRDPRFLQAFADYYDHLFAILTPLQVNYGGPIILMQVENEYGYYGTDTAYLEAIREMMISRGVVVPLITSDGPFPESLSGGRLPGVLQTGNFGSRTEERFAVLKKYVGDGPLMCAEFWVGWFDHWGNGGHMRGNLEQSVKDLDDMLRLGHVNIYMFEGGTNFGFMNGSNYYDELTPDVTSYDYDAVLTEDGQITEKYRRYKEVIAKYAEIPEVKLSTDIKRKAYGRLQVQDRVSLFDALPDLSSPVESPCTLSMEELDQSYGYILYHSELKTEQSLEKIRFWRTGDRVNVFVDRKPVAVYYDRELAVEHELKVDLGRGEDAGLKPESAGTTAENAAERCAETAAEEKAGTSAEHVHSLDILVENMGRVNFGPHMDEQRKGIAGCVQINGHMHHNWEIYPLPLDDVKVDFSGEYRVGTPAFYRFTLDVDEPADTFLDFSGWGKGCIFLNGFNLGRFWEIGPQRRLYIPGPLLKRGENTIIVFETDGKCAESIELCDVPDIG